MPSTARRVFDGLWMMSRLLFADDEVDEPLRPLPFVLPFEYPFMLAWNTKLLACKDSRTEERIE